MKGKNVVCIWQGLGNQMFQYAFAKSLEIHTGRHVFIDAENSYGKTVGEELGSNTFREYGLDNFKISLKKISKFQKSMWYYTRGDKWYYEIIKMLVEQGKYPYKYFSQNGFYDISLPSPAIEEIENNTYIKGWFQSEHYFWDIRDILLKEFTPKKEIITSQNILEAIQNVESVSVHIRLGDFQKNNMVLDKDYYTKAMDLMSRNVRNPIWVVFSDNISHVEKKYCFDGKVIFIDNSYHLKDYEQLILMSKCKHNIIANSTYSWWGAWLNQNKNKFVIAPAKWFNSQRNIVPSEWIRINNNER